MTSAGLSLSDLTAHGITQDKQGGVLSPGATRFHEIQKMWGDRTGSASKKVSRDLIFLFFTVHVEYFRKFVKFIKTERSMFLVGEEMQPSMHLVSIRTQGGDVMSMSVDSLPKDHAGENSPMNHQEVNVSFVHLGRVSVIAEVLYRGFCGVSHASRVV